MDRRENFFWFLGQSLNGPIAWGVDFIHQTRFKAYDGAQVGRDGQPGGIAATGDLLRLKRRAAFPFELSETRVRTLQNSAVGGGGMVKVKVPVFRAPDASAGEKAAPPYTRSLGRAGELGTLFITIAGFMNLICIIDAAWRRRYDAAEDASAAIPFPVPPRGHPGGAAA